MIRSLIQTKSFEKEIRSLIYPKNEKENLSQSEKIELKTISAKIKEGLKNE